MEIVSLRSHARGPTDRSAFSGLNFDLGALYKIFFVFLHVPSSPNNRIYLTDLKMDKNFLKADNSNLPSIDALMVLYGSSNQR